MLKLSLVNLDASPGFSLADGAPTTGFVREVARATKAHGDVYPVFRIAREHALRARTVSNMKQVLTILLIYAQDHDDRLPQASSSEAVFTKLMPYLKSKDIFHTLNPKGGSIQFNLSLSGKNLGLLTSPTRKVVLWETKRWPGGSRCVGFADGSTRVLQGKEANSVP